MNILLMLTWSDHISYSAKEGIIEWYKITLGMRIKWIHNILIGNKLFSFIPSFTSLVWQAWTNLTP